MSELSDRVKATGIDKGPSYGPSQLNYGSSMPRTGHMAALKADGAMFKQKERKTEVKESTSTHKALPHSQLMVPPKGVSRRVENSFKFRLPKVPDKTKPYALCWDPDALHGKGNWIPVELKDCNAPTE